MEKFKKKLSDLWNYFTTYEICWLISILGLSIVVTILFPSEAGDLSIHPFIIMGLYLLDILFNVVCELLISKQSRWNFIVSLLVEITEIITCIVIAERFATMAVTIFFWIPIDIISFINWNKHKDKDEDELTVVRTLKGWQEVLIIAAIVIWTVGVGYLMTVISPEGLLEANSKADIAVCYLDAAASAVGICNGLFILFRIREQWIAWYICTILETVINIIMGQWVLLVLKAGYLTNTTYGYIKWTKYIKSREEKKQKESENSEKENEEIKKEELTEQEQSKIESNETEENKPTEEQLEIEIKEELKKESDIIGSDLTEESTLQEGLFDEDEDSENDLFVQDDVN